MPEVKKRRVAKVPRVKPVKTTSHPVHLEGSYRDLRGKKHPYGY